MVVNPAEPWLAMASAVPSAPASSVPTAIAADSTGADLLAAILRKPKAAAVEEPGVAKGKCCEVGALEWPRKSKVFDFCQDLV